MADFVGLDVSATTPIMDRIESLVERNETFNERRAREQLDDPGPMIGPPTSNDLQTALGHWADSDTPADQNIHGAERIRQEQEGKPEDVTAKRLAANEIHNHYMVTNEMEFGRLADELPAEDTKLDLRTADTRVKALDNLVQNKTGDDHAEDTCAASSLVGAAVLSGGKTGTEGLTTLLNAMDKNADPELRKSLEGDPNDPTSVGRLTELRKRLDKGEVTVEDMHTIQRELYNEMNNKESADAGAAAEKILKDPDATAEQKQQAQHASDLANAAGVQPGTVDKFVKGSPEFAKMLAANDMGVSYIQNDPNQPKSGHAVLTIGAQDGHAGAIYDPELRDDGQIVTNSSELANYQKAEHDHVQ